MIEFTHNDLVDIGYRWVMSRCSFAFKELVTINQEVPDVIGFNSNGSFLLEAKVSRSDFLSDKKKHFRLYGFMGMGDWRFFITPKNLISIDEIPEGWGLIEVNEKNKAKVVHNPFGKGNIYDRWIRNEKNERAEKLVLISALRRLEEKNLIQGNLKNER